VKTATRKALIASAAWTVAGLAFTPVVLALTNRSDAGAYVSAFVLEKTLSLDNVAMFAAVLGAARLSDRTASRVLGAGLLGALVLRVVFIAAGLAVVDAVASIMLVFAAVLVVSGVQMARPRAAHDGPDEPASAPQWLPARLRRSPATAALVAIIFVDVAFAADSILAAFAITTNPFPIIAANVFAVLGLRPLFVILRDAMDRFRYLRAGIGLLLIAIGAELVVEHFVAVPSWVTLVGVGVALTGSIGLSLAAEKGLTMRALLRRGAITVAGFVVLLAGVAMLVLPGPGLLAIVAGLAILATEYTWAKRPLDAMRRRLDQARTAAQAKLRGRDRRNTP
jgi:tellurite resistance protein TerC